MKILVVEDEPKLAAFLKMGLEEQAIEVELASDGLSGKNLALGNHYDVLVLDVNLPRMGGLELARIIRQEGRQTPILMLTALGAVDDKVAGFDAGADDYLVKPFEFRELLARLRSLHKRGGEQPLPDTVLRAADLELHLADKAARRGGRKIELTAKEFALLEYLIRNRNRVVSRVEIAEKVWDIRFDTGTNTIDVYVNFLRKKVDKDFDRKLIHTAIGMGYILKEES